MELKRAGAAARPETEPDASHRQDSFVLEHGVAQLCWPIRMSREEFEDFTDWLLLEHRKIARRVEGGPEQLLHRSASRPGRDHSAPGNDEYQ